MVDTTGRWNGGRKFGDTGSYSKVEYRDSDELIDDSWASSVVDGDKLAQIVSQSGEQRIPGEPDDAATNSWPSRTDNDP